MAIILRAISSASAPDPGVSLGTLNYDYNGSYECRTQLPHLSFSRDEVYHDLDELFEKEANEEFFEEHEACFYAFTRKRYNEVTGVKEGTAYITLQLIELDLSDLLNITSLVMKQRDFSVPL